MNQLDQLKKFSTVVADTGDFTSMRAFTPQDATTNPSLIYKATQLDDYAYLLDKAVAETQHSNLSGNARVSAIIDQLLVLFGQEILKVVPGRVSTEVDARLSFDIEGTLDKARQIIAIYEAGGISRERILIKIASTWEGIRAAEVLQKEGINCNLTLLFSLPQAVACAAANVTLISPFVGRIYDWYCAKENRDYSASEDPGVHSVTTIYNYYKKFGHPTEIMGASFRNTGQILELAGCDLLTISPDLLEQLQSSTAGVTQNLTVEQATSSSATPLDLNESTFRYLLNEDAMATEKTAEGIRKFAADIVSLEKLIARKL